MAYLFRPRKSFEYNLTHLAQLDPTIIDEAREAINILLSGESLPKEFNDHQLKGNLANYNEFHLRDTPKGQKPTETNDVLIIYKIEDQDLVLVAINIGSHSKLFQGRYRKNR